VTAAICTTFSATARRTGDCAARSPGASRKQAPGEVARGAVAQYASAFGAGPVIPHHCTTSRALHGMRLAILAARLIIASSFARPAITTRARGPVARAQRENGQLA
jgi:hypothetical protein